MTGIKEERSRRVRVGERNSGSGSSIEVSLVLLYVTELVLMRSHVGARASMGFDRSLGCDSVNRFRPRNRKSSYHPIFLPRLLFDPDCVASQYLLARTYHSLVLIDCLGEAVLTDSLPFDCSQFLDRYECSLSGSFMIAHSRLRSVSSSSPPLWRYLRHRSFSRTRSSRRRRVHPPPDLSRVR